MKGKGTIEKQIKALKRSIKKFGPGNDSSKLIALATLESLDNQSKS